MIIIFCVKDSVPDVLIERFFGLFGVEGALCAAITVVKTIMTKLLNKQLGLADTSDETDIPE